MTKAPRLHGNSAAPAGGSARSLNALVGAVERIDTLPRAVARIAQDRDRWWSGRTTRRTCRELEGIAFRAETALARPGALPRYDPLRPEPVYTAVDEAQARQRLTEFGEKWGKRYPS